MHSRSSHRIQRQFLEVEFGETEDGFGLQDRLAELYYDRLQPAMEALMDERFGENRYAVADRIELDCGILAEKNWEEELTEKTIRLLKAQLAAIPAKVARQEEAEAEEKGEAFFHYLENGYLPWNSRINSLNELESGIKLDDQLITRLKKTILKHPASAERLLTHFSHKFRDSVRSVYARNKFFRSNSTSLLPEDLWTEFSLETGNPLSTKLMEEIARVISLSFSPPDVEHLPEILFLILCSSDDLLESKASTLEYLADKLKDNPELLARLKTLYEDALQISMGPSVQAEHILSGTIPVTKKADIPDDEVSLTKSKDTVVIPVTAGKSAETQEAIYIDNAGLILLHPFLPVYFEHLGLTRKNEWIDASSQFKAIYASQFLVTGTLEIEEFSLMLNKILCGLKPGDVITPCLLREDDIRTEAEDLLKEVIEQWSILKNTSIGGLRETFLQRQGKLTEVDDGWLLQVERKAVDILLNHLPWGIGLIKLPWMENLLFMEWN